MLRPTFTQVPRRGRLPRFYRQMAYGGTVIHASEGVSGKTLCGRFIGQGWREPRVGVLRVGAQPFTALEFTCQTCRTQVTLARVRARVEGA